MPKEKHFHISSKRFKRIPKVDTKAIGPLSFRDLALALSDPFSSVSKKMWALIRDRESWDEIFSKIISTQEHLRVTLSQIKEESIEESRLKQAFLKAKIFKKNDPLFVTNNQLLPHSNTQKLSDLTVVELQAKATKIKKELAHISQKILDCDREIKNLEEKLEKYDKAEARVWQSIAMALKEDDALILQSNEPTYHKKSSVILHKNLLPQIEKEFEEEEKEAMPKMLVEHDINLFYLDFSTITQFIIYVVIEKDDYWFERLNQNEYMQTECEGIKDKAQFKKYIIMKMESSSSYLDAIQFLNTMMKPIEQDIVKKQLAYDIRSFSKALCEFRKNDIEENKKALVEIKQQMLDHYQNKQSRQNEKDSLIEQQTSYNKEQTDIQNQIRKKQQFTTWKKK